MKFLFFALIFFLISSCNRVSVITTNNALDGGTKLAPTLTLTTSSLSVDQGSAITDITSTALDFTSTVLFSISPALPSGLSLDTSTGLVSGTPTAAQAARTYTITADDGFATKTASFSLTVNSLAPTLMAASQSSATFGSGVTIAPILLTFTGAITSCSITNIGGTELGVLTGLTYNNANCQISGRPREAMEETTFYVVATNSYGQSNTLAVTLKIESAPSMSSISPSEDFTVASETLEINGTGFVPAGLNVKVGGINCPIASASSTQIFCDLPSIALADGLSVENQEIVVTNSNSFFSGGQFIRYKNMAPWISFSSKPELQMLNGQYDLCLTAQEGSAGAEADIYLPPSAIQITLLSGIESAAYLSSTGNNHCFKLIPQLDYYGEAAVQVTINDGRVEPGSVTETFSLTFLPWGGGNGTKKAPYVISDAGHLYHFLRLTHGHNFPAPPKNYSEYLSAHFIQKAKILLDVPVVKGKEADKLLDGAVLLEIEADNLLDGAVVLGKEADNLFFDRAFAKNHLMQLYPYGTDRVPSPFTGHYDGNSNSIEGSLDYLFSFIPVNYGYFGRLVLELNISVETADLPDPLNSINYGIISQQNYGAIQMIEFSSNSALTIHSCNGRNGALGGITGENLGAIHKINSGLNITSGCRFNSMGGISGKFSNGYMIDNRVNSLLRCDTCAYSGGIVGDMTSNVVMDSNGAVALLEVSHPYSWESSFFSLTLKTAVFTGSIYGGDSVGGIVGTTKQNSQEIMGSTTDSEIYFPPSTIHFASVSGTGSINGGMCAGTVVGLSLGVEISNTYSNVEESSTPFIGCASSGTSWQSRSGKFIYYGDMKYLTTRSELLTLNTSDDTPYLSPFTQIESSRFDTISAPLIGQESGDRFFIFNNIFKTDSTSWPTHADYAEDHNYSTMTSYGSSLAPIEALRTDQATIFPTCPGDSCYIQTYYPTLNSIYWYLDSISIPVPLREIFEDIPDFYQQNPDYLQVIN